MATTSRVSIALLLWSFLGAFAGALGGCADGNPALTILYNKAPDSTTCTVTADQGEYIPFGVLGLGSRLGYVFTPLVANYSEKDSDEPFQNVVVLQGADIELLAGFSLNSQAVIDALGADRFRSTSVGVSVQPGAVGVMAFEIVDASQVELLRALVSEEVQIVAHVRVFGEIDGNETSSPHFDYPITLVPGELDPPGTCYFWQY